eukprot:1570763-Prymnesium_polylepis.1
MNESDTRGAQQCATAATRSVRHCGYVPAYAGLRRPGGGRSAGGPSHVPERHTLAALYKSPIGAPTYMPLALPTYRTYPLPLS